MGPGLRAGPRQASGIDLHLDAAQAGPRATSVPANTANRGSLSGSMRGERQTSRAVAFGSEIGERSAASRYRDGDPTRCLRLQKYRIFPTDEHRDLTRIIQFRQSNLSSILGPSPTRSDGESPFRLIRVDSCPSVVMISSSAAHTTVRRVVDIRGQVRRAGDAELGSARARAAFGWSTVEHRRGGEVAGR